MINNVLDNLAAKNLYPVPVFPNSKKPQDKEWQKIKYDRESFLEDNSVGVNLKLSQVFHIDLENEIACSFGARWLPKNTFIIGKKYKKDGREIRLVTNYFYSNN